jgi:hypothetical protein
MSHFNILVYAGPLAISNFILSMLNRKQIFQELVAEPVRPEYSFCSIWVIYAAALLLGFLCPSFCAQCPNYVMNMFPQTVLWMPLWFGSGLSWAAVSLFRGLSSDNEERYSALMPCSGPAGQLNSQFQKFSHSQNNIADKIIKFIVILSYCHKSFKFVQYATILSLVLSRR